MDIIYCVGNTWTDVYNTNDTISNASAKKNVRYTEAIKTDVSWDECGTANT